MNPEGIKRHGSGITSRRTQSARQRCCTPSRVQYWSPEHDGPEQASITPRHVGNPSRLNPLQIPRYPIQLRDELVTSLTKTVGECCWTTPRQQLLPYPAGGTTSVSSTCRWTRDVPGIFPCLRRGPGIDRQRGKAEELWTLAAAVPSIVLIIHEAMCFIGQGGSVPLAHPFALLCTTASARLARAPPAQWTG